MTPVDIDKLKADYAALGIDPGVEWYALIHKGGYDLCLENAKWRRGSGNGDDVIGRFTCGEYAIKCLPVVAQALNALPALIAKAERVDEMERVLLPLVNRLTESEASFTKADELIGGPITDEDGVFVSIGELRAARNALSPKESE